MLDHGGAGGKATGRAGAVRQWQGTFRALAPAGAAHRSMTIGYFLHGRLRGTVRITRLGRGPRRSAEIALSVEPAWQGCGIGTLLMAEAVRRARAADIACLYLRCHALNSRMQRLAAKFGAIIGFEDCQCFAHIAVQGAPAR
jgi:RimJ/RimL family protein N-acetyltransferase